MFHTITIVLGLAAAACCNAQSVTSRDGRIVYRALSGQEAYLTDGPHDYDPNLAPDKQTVVFVREIQGHIDASAQGRVVEKSQLCVIDLRHHAAIPTVILNQPVAADGMRSQWFQKPMFSTTDGRMVYFTIPDYSTVSSGLFAIDLRSGKYRFIVAALKYWPMPCGPYRGDIIVWRNPQLLGGGRYDIFTMIQPSGLEIGVVGFVEASVDRFIAACQGVE